MSVPDFLTENRRKCVRHFDLPGDAHFLTFSCYKRLPLLGKDRTRKWLVEAIRDARAALGFELWAWVIMPEHVHLLIHPLQCEHGIASILARIKKPVGAKSIKFLRSRGSRFLERLTVRNKNRTYHRFWQAGPGQDHNIYDPDTAHCVVEYIHNNPVRRGLVSKPEDWYWSSVRDWCGATDIPLNVDRTLPMRVETV